MGRARTSEDKRKDWLGKWRAGVPRGRYRIERQLRKGGQYTLLRMLDAGVGPMEADAEFRQAVHRAASHGGTSRCLRMLGPDGSVAAGPVDVEGLRRVYASESGRVMVVAAGCGGKGGQDAGH